MTGYDARDNVRSEMGSWITRDASGAAVEGGGASTIQGPAYFHYAITADGLVVDSYCSGKRDGLDAGPAESVARALKVVQAPRKWSISLHLFFRAFHPDADRR